MTPDELKVRPAFPCARSVLINPPQAQADLSLSRALLQASIEAHNASFDELLRHVPAKYYIRPESDDEDETPKQSVRPVANVRRAECIA